MANVNTPQTKVPPSLFEKDPELFKYLSDLQFWQQQIFTRTGGGQDLIEEAGDTITNIINNLTNTAPLALIDTLHNIDNFTCDDTGFTCDLDVFSTDMETT